MTLFMRAEAPRFSIERLFQNIVSYLPRGFHLAVVTVPNRRATMWAILGNLWYAFRRRGRLNHVTGDIHYVTAVLPRKHTVLTIHDCVGLRRSSGIKRWLMLWWWYALPVRRAAVVTTISEASRRELCRFVPEASGKTRVIPDCYGPEFSHHPKVFARVRPVILQIGTKANKNLNRVAKALKGVQCHLRIIGALTAEQIDALDENGVDYSAVEGISDDQMLQEYIASDMVIFASTYEGFGVPILEAQGVGRPVVVSDREPMRSVAGEGACLVDPEQSESIGAAVRRLIGDEDYRRRCVQEGLINAQRFSPEEVAERYAEVYRELVADPDT